MTNPNEYDFSVRNAPPDWVEALEDSGATDTSPLRTGKHRALAAKGKRLDLFGLGVMIAASMIVAGAIWYVAETRMNLDSPWLATAVAAAISIGARIGGGARGAGVKAVASLCGFALTFTITGVAIAWYKFDEIYQQSPTLTSAQSSFRQERLTGTLPIAAVAVGALLIVAISFATSTQD